MSRRRFYVPRDCIHGNIALLPKDQTHHLRDVLRLKAGDAVELFDGEGAAYSGLVDDFNGEIRVASLKRLESPAECGSGAVLVQAVLKTEKFEWVLQKATELGVREIRPVETRFCTVRLRGNRAETRLERWNRIAREASKQCRRATVPQVHAPLRFTELVRHFATCGDTKLLFCEKASLRWDVTLQIRSNAVLCIGPEGGWDSDEVEAATRAGFLTFNLGPRILRAETAALAALVLVQFQSGDQAVATAQ